MYKQQNSVHVLSAVKKQIRSGAGAKVSSVSSKSLRCILAKFTFWHQSLQVLSSI